MKYIVAVYMKVIFLDERFYGDLSVPEPQTEHAHQSS